nr:FCD domain-containing protein [Asticcacaulis currens]
MVQVRKGSGIFVTEDVPESTPSTDLKTSAFELIEARILFEGEAAAVAAVTVTPEDIVELEAILQEMEREIKAGPARGPADRQFHMKIAEATQNATIVHVVSMLWDIGQESIIYKHFQMAAAQAGFRVRLDEHEAILNALKQKDAQAARLAMREHLTRVMNNMLQATESEEIERARREIAEKRENVRKRIAM